MKRICAWCRNGAPTVEEGDDVTHGICKDCVNKLFENETSLQQVIEQLGIPVFVVDSDAAISTFNTQALDVLGIVEEPAHNMLLGKTFDCIYSTLPGGCGKTTHCASCVLRQTIMTTFKTGVPQVMVPATFRQGPASDPAHIDLVITTFKRSDNVVLVKIDRAETRDSKIKS
jgi:hypothetical protein